MKDQPKIISLFLYILCGSSLLGLPGGPFVGSAGGAEPGGLLSRKNRPKADRPQAENPGTSHQIRVILFGQPCILQGPFEEATLKGIHEISPEQIAPKFSLLNREAGAGLKRALGKLSTAAKLPSVLDRYRDRVTRRLEAQAAFAEGLQAALKTQKSTPLLNQVKSHLPPKKLKSFEALAKRLDGRKHAQLSEQLDAAYNDLIEPDPEEEFHVATQKLGLKYICAFEEAGDDPEDKSGSQNEPSTDSHLDSPDTE